MSRLSILFHWAICLLLKAQFLNIKEVPVKPRSSCNRRCPGDTLPLPMTQEVLSRDQEGVGASCWEHRKGEGSQQPEWLWALKQEPRLREKQRDRLSQQGHQQKSIAKGRSTGRLCAPGHALIGGRAQMWKVQGRHTEAACARPHRGCRERFGKHLGLYHLQLQVWSVWSVKVTQLCPTLCDPTDYTVHGILQAGILEWLAFPSSRGSSQPRNRTQVSCIAGRFFTSWASREAQWNRSG